MTKLMTLCFLFLTATAFGAERSTLQFYNDFSDREDAQDNVLTRAGGQLLGFSVSSTADCNRLQALVEPAIAASMSSDSSSAVHISNAYQETTHCDRNMNLCYHYGTCSLNVLSEMKIVTKSDVVIFQSTDSDLGQLRAECLTRANELFATDAHLIAVDFSKGWHNGKFTCSASLFETSAN